MTTSMTIIDHKSMCSQRRILSILCLLLAPTCILFGLFGKTTNVEGWWKSISATFFCNSNILMIGLLVAIAIYFFSYKGYDIRDRICSIIEAVSSLGIVCFPCNSIENVPERIGLFNLPNNISMIIHCVFAGILFVAFGFNILFLFTLSVYNPTKEKKVRNVIYRVCGIIILTFCVIQGVTSTIWKWYPEWYPNTLVNEFIMLLAFGIAYLIKSESIRILNDKNQKTFAKI